MVLSPANALDNHSLSQLLDQLDAQAGPVDLAQGGCRADALYKYRVRTLRVDMRQPQQPSRSFAVHARLLGTRALCAVSTTWLRPEVPCVVYLIDAESGWDEVPGRVAACDPLTQADGLWELRVTFDRAIDVPRFAPPAWRCRILVADDSLTVCRILTQALARHHADVTCVANGRQAVAAALAERFDLILLDMDMPELDGPSAARELREKGYLWMIVALTASTTEASHYLCINGGCDAFVNKPVQSECLADLVRAARPKPLISAMISEPGFGDVIDACVHELRAAVAEMQVAFAADDAARLLKIATHIRVETPAAGFPVLARLAARVERAISDGFPLRDVRRALCPLAVHCLAARPATRFD